MTTSSKIQEKVVEYLSDQENHSVQEIKAYLSACGIEDYTEGQFAGSLNTLQRNATICKIDRGVYSIKKRSEDMRQCFVVSPIGDEGSDIRVDADQLFKYVIKPVCKECGLNPIRVDTLNDANSITQTIIEHLDSADLVIADISGHNPNVFYEMGYRARTKKPMIHLKKKGEALPFDVNTIRTFEYDLRDLDSVEEVKERLQKTIESFTFSDPAAESVEESVTEKSPTSAIMPVLYQILDAMSELKTEVKKFSTEPLEAVVRSMQPVQPQMPPETMLQMQLINGLMQNPDNIVKIIELSKTMKNTGKTK